MADTGMRKDPPCTHNFEVRIDGVRMGAFSEVTGLTADGDTVPYREGTDKVNSVRQLMCMRRFGPIQCRHGIMNTEMWDWYADVWAGNPDGKARRNGTIILQDEAHRPVLEVHFSNGFLNKWVLSDFKASANEVAIESVEIVHEGLEITLP
jgi:phage tail-like protein